ncbi:MAG: ABC transporter permease [Syntrophaceae bacterium]|nr:ABC transporter permease [Syntrophaceae bacterium]
MNLALKDIRHNLSRFSLTALGIGMLLMIVMGMGGIYQGLIQEATLLVDNIGADLWVVQRETRGPFAEISRIPRNLEDRLKSMPGVVSARAFVTYPVQREFRDKPLRMQIQGLSWPDDRGAWLPLVAGRRIESAHYEMIVDQILGLGLGDKVKLGKNVYTVVGITKNMSSMAGDGLAFFTLLDALDIQYDYSGEAIRIEREARRWRVAKQDIGATLPSLLERALLPSSNLAALPTPYVSAVLVTLFPGTNVNTVVEKISGWTDVTVFTRDQQNELLLRGVVDRARRQLGLFRSLLIVISTIIMALIIYTLTLEKIHDIAMLKLIGARNSVILGLILQQALLLGFLGYIFAFYVGKWVFPMFPRRVVINADDLIYLAMIVFVISILSAGLGIWKALSVEPNEVVS